MVRLIVMDQFRFFPTSEPAGRELNTFAHMAEFQRQSRQKHKAVSLKGEYYTNAYQCNSRSDKL